jgi:DNA replication protein DnaC
MVPPKKLESIKNRIRESCQCKGRGCSICASKIERLTRYARAGIPVRYWDLAFKDFQGDPNFGNFIRTIMSDIEGFYDKGESLAFIGNLGTGKSYAACCILKMGLVNDYSGLYVQMAEIVNNTLSPKVDSAEYLEKLINVDILVIDEFDPRWVFPSEKVEKMFGTTLEYILRTRFQNSMPTVLCSNANDIDKVLSNDFARAFSSLRSMYMKVVLVAGKDFRKNGKN